MTISSTNTSQITRYLLGRLSEDEQARFEEQLLEDDALFEALEEVESELIDDYVCGNLSPDDRKQFELYFLTTPRRRERVEFAEALHQVAAERKRERELGMEEVRQVREASPDIIGQPRPWWESLFAWPRLGALATACAVIALGGLGLSVVQNSRLRAQLHRMQEERASLQRQSAEQVESLNQQLASERDLRRRLEELIDMLNTIDVTVDRGSQPSIISFVLRFISAGVSRGPGDPEPEPQQLVIPAGTDLVRLKLPVQTPRTDFTSYRVSLQRADDPKKTEIWSRSGLPAVSKPGQQITLRLPASLITEGDYMIKLTGVLSGDNTESIGEYLFTVVWR